MENILTYLKWRGDLAFAERPFCEADNLALSELAYLDLAGIVPEVSEEKSITLQEASVLFYSQNRSSKCGDGPPEDYLAVMASSNRYRAVRLSCFYEELDKATGTDFCALHIELEDDSFYVAFRGTSDSLIGWREDFSMSFQLMPSQTIAAKYLETTMNRENGRYRVGGHSKGGNLAAYAAMMLPECKQEQIIEIYSNDGPGLCPDIVEMERYHGISHKLIRIVPEFSVIGALFERETPTKIVKSDASGFLQHDGMTWQIEGDHFCTVPTRSAEAEYYNHIFDQWIESATLEQRKSFTNDLFDALEAGGSQKLTDITGNGFESFESILLSVIQSDGKTKAVIGKFIQSFLGAFQSIQFKQLFRQKKTIQGFALFILGLFLAAAPEVAAQCVGVGIGVAVAIWLGKRQLDFAFTEKGKEPGARGKMVLNMILMCLVVFLIAQNGLLLRFTNILMGDVFLFLAYRWAKKGFVRIFSKGTRMSCLVFAAISLAMGVVPLISPGLILHQYVFTTGTFAMLFGTGIIVRTMYENGKENCVRKPFDGC